MGANFAREFCTDQRKVGRLGDERRIRIEKPDQLSFQLSWNHPYLLQIQPKLNSDPKGVFACHRFVPPTVLIHLLYVYLKNS
jgi:hypothetical protein